MNTIKLEGTLRKGAASSLAAALILMSPGLGCYEAFAANITAEGAAVGAVGAVPTASVRTGAGAGVAALPSLGTVGVDVSAGTGVEIQGLAASASAVSGLAPSAQAQSIVGGAARVQTAGAAASIIKGEGVSAGSSGVGIKASKASAAEVVGSITTNDEVREITAQDSKAGVSGQHAASARLFDAAKTGAGSEDLAVTGREGAGAGRLSRGGRLKAAAAAGVATVAMPAAAFASDAQSASGSSDSSIIGPLIVGGIAVLTATAVGRVAVRVNRTLDNKPTEQQTAAYLAAKDVIQMDQIARSRGFNGDRIGHPDVERVMRREITKKTGKEPDDAVAEALEVARNYERDYAAAVHPIIAKIVRAFKRDGGSGGGSTGGKSEDQAVPKDAAERYTSLKRELTGIYRMQMIAGHRDMIGAQIEDRSERIPEIVKEMNALEKEHPALGKMSAGSKAALAVLATVAGILGLSLISATAAVIAGVIAAAVGVVAFNIFMLSRMTPEEQKKMGEMARNMSLYK